MKVESGALILGAMALLVLPLRWVAGAAAAAAVHECCHWAAVLALGGRVEGLYLGAAGAQMQAWGLTWGRAVVATLAGPAGSLAVLALGRKFPEMAICAGVQGAYNLLPLSSLDGGRALGYLLQRLWPAGGWRIGRAVEIGALTALGAGALWAAIALKWGAGPLLFGAVVTGKGVLRKKP